MEEQLKLLQVELARIEPKPGEVFVLKAAHRLTAEQGSRLHRIMAEVFPENKCLVMDCDLELTVAKGAAE